MPRRKYRTLVLHLHASLAQTHERQQAQDGAARGRKGATLLQAPARKLRVLRQTVHLRLIYEEVEGVEAAERASRIVAVQPRALLALGLELHEALVRPLAQFGDRPELDRIRWTRLGAGRLEPDLHPVVAQRAFLRRSLARVHVDHAEGAGGDAGAAAVAHVRLDDDRVELGANNRARGADLQAPRLDAVLATI